MSEKKEEEEEDQEALLWKEGRYYKEEAIKSITRQEQPGERC